MKKITALILASLILASSFASCSDNSDESETRSSETESTASANVESAEEEDDGTTHYYNDIAAVDYGGWNFNITSRSRGGNIFTYCTVEDMTGDEFNDAVYNRVVALEDKFNITVWDDDSDGVNEKIMKSIQAGTKDYALALSFIEDVSGLIGSDYLMSITDIPVSLDQPYWDKGAQDALMINDKLFYGVSDITFDHYESCAVLFYNGYHLTDNQITESPYDLYKEGKWTMDAMYTMMKTVARDLDGNGDMEEGVDLFGLTGRILRNQPALAASDVDIIKYDEATQSYALNLTNETVMAVGHALAELMYDDATTLMEGEELIDFKAGKSLFDSHLLGDFRGLRDKEDDYGIITWPSLEENMESKAYIRNCACILVPSDCEDGERLATILDAMAAYGIDYIRENYISKAVVGKGARDKESAEIVRGLADRKSFDVVCALDLKDVAKAWETSVRTDTYASREKTVAKAVKAKLNAILEVYYD